MNEKKDISETKNAICLLDGEKVTIAHRRIEVPNRPGDPTFLRVDSWNCNRSQNCRDSDCLGKVHDGMIKGWSET